MIWRVRGRNFNEVLYYVYEFMEEIFMGGLEVNIVEVYLICVFYFIYK